MGHESNTPPSAGALGRENAALIRDLEALGQPLAGSGLNQAIRTLCESEERYRLVTELCRDAITVTDEAGIVVYVNPAMQEIFGYTHDEIVGTNLAEHFNVVHPDDVDQVATSFEGIREVGDKVYYAPMRCRHKDGSWRWIKSISASYLSSNGERYLLEVHQDISDQVATRQREEEHAGQIRERQRLESLGVLAGGIAHDFNNLLAPILGDSSLALLDLPANSLIRTRLERIHAAAQRAAALTEQMLAYSGQRPSLTEAIDVSRLVEEMAQLLEGPMSGKAEITLMLSPDLPAVEADATQVSQVVMNLITNATEALQDGRGRALLCTGLIDAEKIDRSLLVGNASLIAASYVFIEVSDNGCGMDAETQSRIFDPFFTTKFTGRGLGLAATLGIVRSHDGVIEIDSEVGRGTRFRVLFPSAGYRALPSAPEHTTAADWRSHGCVLVADDDEAVRDLVAETLKRAGLTVLLARDGREAIEIFRQQPDTIRVVLLDRTMPDVGGEEALTQIRDIRPDAPVILMSGYSEGRAAHSMDQELDAFLHKPFEPLELIDRVRALF